MIQIKFEKSVHWKYIYKNQSYKKYWTDFDETFIVYLSLWSNLVTRIVFVIQALLKRGKRGW